MGILTIISGGLLTAAGIFCLANGGLAFMYLAFPAGAVMIIDGAIQSVAYIWGRGKKRKESHGWILADGLVTLFLGGAVILDFIKADISVPMILGTWAIVSGVLRIVASTHIDRYKKAGNFKGTLWTGVALTAAGIYGFLNGMIGGLSTTAFAGMLLVVRGAAVLELGIHMPHKRDGIS